MFFYNTGYLIFMLPAFILMLLVQFYVSSSYNKWNRVASRSGLSGAEVARRLVERGGLSDVEVE